MLPGALFFPLLLPVNPFYALELEDDILLHHVRQRHNFFQQTISNLVKQTEPDKDRQPSINKGSAPGPGERCPQIHGGLAVLTPETGMEKSAQASSSPSETAQSLSAGRRMPVGGRVLSTVGGSARQD